MAQEVPKTLYQYLAAPSPATQEKRDVVTEKILSEKRFKVSRFSGLNDPLDMVPAFKLKISYAEAYDALAHLAEKSGDVVTPIKPLVERFRNEWGKRDFRMYSAENMRSRLLCLTRRNDGVMMWSHYASRHRGFVVGFRSDVVLRDAGGVNLFPITYHNDRQLCGPQDFHIRRGLNGSFTYGLAEKVFSQKSKEWEYEEEWRSLIPSSSLVDAEFLPFPVEAVSEIILGADLTIETEKILRKAWTDGGFGPVVGLWRGRYSDTEFKIHIDPAKWRV